MQIKRFFWFLLRKNEKLFFLCYWVLFGINKNLAFLIKHFFFRKSVMDPANLDLLYLSETAYWNVRRKFFPKEFAPQKTIQREENKKLKIGFVGIFHSQNTNILESDFFLSFPDHAELYVYELEYNGANSEEKLSEVSEYRKFHLDQPEGIKERIFADTFDYHDMAAKINNDELDIVLIGFFVRARYNTLIKLIELLETPQIVPISFGSHFIVDDKCKEQSMVQLPACYKIENKVLHSSLSGSVFNGYRFLNDLILYDDRGIGFAHERIEKETGLMFIHSRLTKLASFPYLNMIARLLKKDQRRRFYFMGLDENNSLQTILDFFESVDLDEQIEYVGSFASKDDRIGWEKCKTLLKQSVLFPESFPRHQGSGKFEAFGCGAPVVSLLEDYFDCKNQDKITGKLEVGYTKAGVAKNLEEYEMLCEKALDNKEFREELIKEQYQEYDSLCDPKVFWQKIFQLYNGEKVKESKAEL